MYGASHFDSFKPIFTHTALLAFELIKLYGPTGKNMELHWQVLAQNDGKIHVALEDSLQNINSFCNRFSARRQAELLTNLIERRETIPDRLIHYIMVYQLQNLEQLNYYFPEEGYTEEEIRRMVQDRTTQWMPTIVEAMRAGSAFIAVGVTHLGGEQGLVNLLRRQGFTVTPIPIN
jgi:uncharacterized protein YbaP (TraB family)